jgi:hypothetical protein
MKASDGRDPRGAIDRSAGSAYAGGPVHYVLFDARVGSSGRITHETDIASGRPVADVKKVDRHQTEMRFSEWVTGGSSR